MPSLPWPQIAAASLAKVVLSWVPCGRGHPGSRDFWKGFDHYVLLGSSRRDLSLLSSEDHVPLPQSLCWLLHAHLSLQLSLTTSPSQQALGRGTRVGWGGDGAPLHDIIVCVHLVEMASLSKTAETIYKLLFFDPLIFILIEFVTLVKLQHENCRVQLCIYSWGFSPVWVGFLILQHVVLSALHLWSRLGHLGTRWVPSLWHRTSFLSLPKAATFLGCSFVGHLQQQTCFLFSPSHPQSISSFP